MYIHVHNIIMYMHVLYMCFLRKINTSDANYYAGMTRNVSFFSYYILYRKPPNIGIYMYIVHVYYTQSGCVGKVGMPRTCTNNLQSTFQLSREGTLLYVLFLSLFHWMEGYWVSFSSFLASVMSMYNTVHPCSIFVAYTVCHCTCGLCTAIVL